MFLKRCLSFCLLLLLAGACLAQAAKKPSILFCCPGENRYQNVGYDYLKALVNAGFDVDFIEGAEAFTWERVKNYNVLFIYGFPARDEKDAEFLFPLRPPWRADYFAVIERFLQAGGGVFLHYTRSAGESTPNDLLKTWGLQAPVQYIKDTYTALMSNLGDSSRCAFTNQILPSPVSEGVRGIWYPIDPHYCAAHTMPIIVDKNWAPVVKASKTAYGVIPTFDRGGWQPNPDAYFPQEPIKDPVLFAIREFPGGGRLAVIQQWFQFSVGSGMKWLYNNEVLSKGLDGKPSDYGKLLENSYRWLAAPSLQSGAVGGHVTDMARIVEPMLRPGVREQYKEWGYTEKSLQEYQQPPSGKFYRGLFGAQTALSGGTGTVADYAKAAADAKLDFLVFLEDFSQMTPEKLETLKAQVKQFSTETLQLFAGYKIKANTGNWMFMYGEALPWPEDRVLVGPDKRTFHLQYQDEHGKWALGNPSLDWALYTFGLVHSKNNIGFYNFANSGKGMRVYDIRGASVAALRTYENGKLIEDMTDEYLTTAQSTSVMTPVSVNLVKSPQEMLQAVNKNQALTYAGARSLKLLMADALRGNSPYDGLSVFVSDGPKIESWPRCLRVLPYGAENFVSGLALLPANIHVTSTVGLKEISIYDGQELFRRFSCNGVTDFKTTLYFSGVVCRNMVLIAEDVKGGKATSFAYRNYKEGSKVPVFCSDHVNDGGYMLLARGPLWASFCHTPSIPNAGGTWDGGPVAVKPLLKGEFTNLAIATKQKYLETGSYPYQVPLLEFADECAVRCRMVSNRQLADGVPSISPWHTFGPLEPSKEYDCWSSHTYYQQYLTGVDPNSYGPGVMEGPVAGLFTEQITFKQPYTLQRIRFFHTGWRGKSAGRSILLAAGRGGQIKEVLDLSDTPEEPQKIRLETGDWFALFSGQPANTHLFINRGSPVLLEAWPHTKYWLSLWTDTGEQEVKPGDSYGIEFFNMTWPMNQPIQKASAIAEMAAYLDNPTGLQLIRGKRTKSTGGLLELDADNYAVELSIPKPQKLQVVNVPVRVSGFNKRWSVGLYQIDGYRTHYYAKENSGWTSLGLDFNGRAYVPMYVSLHPNTHMRIGHPIVADTAGKDLFIQVTRLNEGENGRGPGWHISVNNPTDKPITTVLKGAMEVPGLEFIEERVTVLAGEYRVLVNKK